MATKTRASPRRKATASQQALKDRVAREAILAERARRLAEPQRKVVDLVAHPTALVCAIADNLYAAPLDAVARTVPLTRLGAAPSDDPTLIGLAVDGGRVLQVFDLAARLDLGAASREATGYLLVLRQGQAALRVENRPTALRVEALNGVEPDRARIVDPASPLDGRVVVMLSPDTLLSFSPRPQPEPVSL